MNSTSFLPTLTVVLITSVIAVYFSYIHHNNRDFNFNYYIRESNCTNHGSFKVDVASVTFVVNSSVQLKTVVELPRLDKLPERFDEDDEDDE